MVSLAILVHYLVIAHRDIQPPHGKNANPSGLGRAIMNKKVKDARTARETGLVSSIYLGIYGCLTICI